MFWIISLSVSILGALVSCYLLSRQWHNIIGSNDPIVTRINLMTFDMVSVMHPEFPHFAGFWDLKWSVIRHAVVFFILAILIRFVPVRFIRVILYTMYALYTWAVWERYAHRKKQLAELKKESSSPDLWKFCCKLVKPCKIVFVYSCICAVSLFFVPFLGSEVHNDGGYSAGYEAGYQAALDAATETTVVTKNPQSPPYSGTVHGNRIYDYEDHSEITIHASSGHDCVVKLKHQDGSTALTFYVRAGETATVNVPQQNLYVYFAEGTDWYGWNDLFGEETAYSRDKDPVDFSAYTIEYTLYMVSNGNLTLDQIDPEDF